MKSSRAWIITWDAAADPRDGVAPNQVLIFLDARLGYAMVTKIMQALWISHSRLYWRERLEFATKKKNLSPVFVIEHKSVIYVGVKPRLVGRIVKKLEAIDREDGGCVRWIEQREKEVFMEQTKLPHPK